MNKSPYTYQIPDVLLADIARLAKEQGIDVSHLIDKLLFDYVKESDNPSDISERRAFPRKSVNNQAVIQLNMSPRAFNYRSVTVKDISMGGLLVEFSNDHAVDGQSVNENSTVEIIFNFTQEGKPISFVCRPCHIKKEEEHLSMGLSFVDGSFKEYKELAYHLLQ